MTEKKGESSPERPEFLFRIDEAVQTRGQLKLMAIAFGAASAVTIGWLIKIAKDLKDPQKRN